MCIDSCYSQYKSGAFTYTNETKKPSLLGASSHRNSTSTGNNPSLAYRVGAIFTWFFSYFSRNNPSSSSEGLDEHYVSMRDLGDFSFNTHEVQRQEIKRALDTWSKNNLDRKIAADKILTFINNKEENNLDLKGLQLGTLPNIFESRELQERLVVLELSNTKLTTLPASINKLKKLERLSLAGNPITQIPGPIFCLPKSCTVCLDNNVPQNLKAFLQGKSNGPMFLFVSKQPLQKLEISNWPQNSVEGESTDDSTSAVKNQASAAGRLGCFARLFCCFQRNPQMEKLMETQQTLDAWAHENSVRKQAADKILAFMKNKNESILDFKGLQLETLPDIFGSSEFVHRLVGLELSDTNLKTIPASLSNLRALDYLHLGGNALTALPSSILELPTSCLVRLDKRLSESVEGLVKDKTSSPVFQVIKKQGSLKMRQTDWTDI